MESAGARRRQGAEQNDAKVLPPMPTRAKKTERGTPIPKFTVNLSVAPEQRYAHIAPQFRDQVSKSDLPGLFNELVSSLAGPVLCRYLITLARVALRRVYSREETAELRGISKAGGVDMHVLVAFNVLLDLLLGCTSGGIRVGGGKGESSGSQMMHFRTLDWGMDRLRDIVVEIDFVRSDGGPVVATSLTYLGYVGVLTGVRQGLSMSLNFRPRHDRSTRRKELAFRWHQAMVVLGFRQSISSVLRQVLFDASADGTATRAKDNEEAPLAGDDTTDRELESLLAGLSLSRSTAAYLILCRPQRVYVVEKDNRTASVRSSDTFLTAYNHDASDEVDSSQLAEAAEELAAGEDAIGMSQIVAYSLDRKWHLDQLWERRVKACRRQFRRQDDTVTMEDVMRFVQDREISNEETHYAVVMDPRAGKILWRRRYDA